MAPWRSIFTNKLLKCGIKNNSWIMIFLSLFKVCNTRLSEMYLFKSLMFWLTLLDLTWTLLYPFQLLESLQLWLEVIHTFENLVIKVPCLLLASWRCFLQIFSFQPFLHQAEACSWYHSNNLKEDHYNHYNHYNHHNHHKHHMCVTTWRRSRCHRRPVEVKRLKPPAIPMLW